MVELAARNVGNVYMQNLSHQIDIQFGRYEYDSPEIYATLQLVYGWQIR